MSVTFQDEYVSTNDLPRDETPIVDAGAEYPCRVCGLEAGPYGGRGPKPKLCPEHKKSTPAGKRGVSAPRNSNAVMAASAADALNQINSMMVVGGMVLGFIQTASAIAERQDAFREQAYSALLTDPALCASILKAGTTSGKMALGIAYLMLGAGVAPYAVSEFKERKAERDEARITDE
jgi:hypothetical protein